MEATAQANIPPRLKERYEAEIRQRLQERFGYHSPMEVPRLEKITLNMGVGEAKQDSNMLEAAQEQLATLAGQAPNVRRARKSIANFKLREGMAVGVKATLRGERMYEMLDRLQSIAIPRIRDFRGLSPRSFDGRGNFSLGIREQIIFPEIDYDAIDEVRGLDVTITTSAASDEEGYELLRLLGMPFRTDNGAAAATRPAEAPAQEAAAQEAEAPQAEAVAATEAEAPAEAPQADESEPPAGASQETVEERAAEGADEMPQDSAAETSADESEEA
jgi:large subunit ribosomal protein L5